MKTQQHAPRVPNKVDIHVGAQIRLRRQILKMSQEKLGDQLGVTFQQVQKYERGTNRVGASRLYRVSKALDVSIQSLFDGLDDTSETSTVDNTVIDFIQSTDGVSLANAVVKLRKPIRRQLLEMARTMAGETTDLIKV